MVGRTLKEISIIVDLSWYYRKQKKYEIVNTFEKLLPHIEKMKKAPLLSFDTETTGVKICALPWLHKDKDVCVGFSISYERDQGIYIPLQHTEFNNMPMDIVVKYLFPLFEKLAWCGHNTIFDQKVFYDMGCKVNVVHDSMLLLFNIYSKLAKGSKALKNATRLLYGDTTIEFPDIFEDSKDYGLFKYVDEEVARIYTCSDSDYPLQIILDNYDFLDEKQQEAYMRDVSFSRLIAVSEYHGKPIDVTRLPKCVENCRENIKNLEEILFNYVGWKITGDLNEVYRFKTTSSPELVDVFYNKLKITPVDSKNKTGYKVDKHVLKKLKQRNSKDEDRFIRVKLSKGLRDLQLGPEQSEKEKLLSGKELIKKECIPAFIISALRKQYKNLTSFFNKIVLEANSDVGIYFSGISMTNTETARLVDFIQTLDSGLKYLIAVPKNSGKYMFNFDFAQIEYRVMAALANMRELCDKLTFSHTDFHVELAAIITNTLPELITPAVRKMFKPINFSIPYGTGVGGLVDSIYGIGLTDEEREKAEKEINGILALWMMSLPQIMQMLNAYRDIATKPRPYVHPMTRNVETTSYLHTPDGRVRVFDLKDMSDQLIAKVRRASGNTPIQAYARTIYLQAVNDLYEALVEEGLSDVLVKNESSMSGYSFTSKVTINGFIHDEIIGTATNDVNPYFLYNLIEKHCMKKLKGHPTYWCGINICNNWKDGKDGEFEAPIDYVYARKSTTKFVEPQENWVRVVADDMTDWVNNASIEYVESLAGDLLAKNKVLDVDSILPKWKDYYYKTKVRDYGNKALDTLLTDKNDDEVINKLVGILLKYRYKGIRLYWKSQGIDQIVSSLYDTEKVKSIKEVDVGKQILDSVDYDEDDTDDDFDDDYEYSMETNSVLVNGTEWKIEDNIKILEKVLEGGVRCTNLF